MTQRASIRIAYGKLESGYAVRQVHMLVTTLFSMVIVCYEWLKSYISLIRCSVCVCEVLL